MIRWFSMAEPQLDGSDTDVALQLSSTGKYANLRMPRAGARLKPIWPELGRAALIHANDTSDMMPSETFKPQEFTADFVPQGLKLIDLWPAVRAQCARLLITVCPMTFGVQGGHGCSCGQFSDDFGWIYVTSDDAVGFAEGIVHEMAHWKLRALGIWFEEWTPLLLANDPSERYDSPVRKDITRPMGAVLHGQYSYVHVAQMTLKVVQSLPQPDAGVTSWLAVHINRIAEGQQTIRAHARWTLDGESFAAGLDDWTTRVREEAAPYVN